MDGSAIARTPAGLYDDGFDDACNDGLPTTAGCEEPEEEHVDDEEEEEEHESTTSWFLEAGDSRAPSPFGVAVFLPCW